ncbi:MULTISPECIES: DUF5050 domain-containing protein [Clostridium]|uniref:DUF5050 domain-containing protein n=1 Tax=Clostridium frigoriphilum TaxID=443253 RepID=A0ABU7UXS8_9CLOT|nr:DUF5050 domain-containing protein [Clostridium sp. DSM 17811]MBU3101784.1 DUF5050 domain-containing protein [Clostridium sp. DSM 17811]
MINKKLYSGLSRFIIASMIVTSVSGVADAATEDIINTTNKKIYNVTSSKDVQALIEDLKDGGGDQFLKEDTDGKYYSPNDKLTAQSREIVKLLKAANVSLTDSTAIKTYIKNNAAKIVADVKVETDKVATQTVDTSNYTSPKVANLTVSLVSAINATETLGDTYTLPTTVTVILSDVTTKDLAVTWNKVASTTVAGTYTFTGVLTMVAGVVNTDNLTVLATLTVNALTADNTPLYLGEVNGGTFSSRDELAINDKENVYYYKNTIDPKIKVVSADGSTQSNISNTGTISDFLVDAGWIYYTSSENYSPSGLSGNLYRMAIDGTQNSILCNYVTSLELVKYGSVYYQDFSVSGSVSLYKMNLDGSNKIKILDKSSCQYQSLSVINNYIYYINYADSMKLYRVNVDGTNNVKVLDDPISSYYFYNNNIYYSTEDSISHYTYLYRANLDGISKVKLGETALIICGIDNEWIYGIDSKNSLGLVKTKLDGSGLTIIRSTRSYDKINVSTDWIYYINDDDNDSLYKVRKDGNENQKISNSRKYNVYNDSVFLLDDSADRNLYISNTTLTNTIKVSDDNMKNIVIVGDWIYYTNSDDNNKLYKIGSNGVNRQKLCDDNMSFGFKIVGDYVYYINHSSYDQYYKIRTNGTERVAVKFTPMFNIVISDGWIYFSNNYTTIDGSLHRMKIDGTNEEIVSKDKLSDYGINAIFIKDDYIYYINKSDNDSFYRVNKDGTGKIKISDDYMVDAIFENGWIYYGNRDDDWKPYKIKIDGTNKTKISSDNFYNFTVNDGFIYYKNYSNGNLLKIGEDGTGKMQLTNNSVSAFSVTGDWIYYDTYDQLNFYRMKKDGTSRVQIK